MDSEKETKQRINKIIEEYGNNCSPSFYIKQGILLQQEFIIENLNNTRK